jgi:anti-anti-sigma regulatory factor/anti-sigma regulatory factor (Ser/Thr protein kinase)
VTAETELAASTRLVDAVPVIELRGRLTRFTTPCVRRVVRKALTDSPAAIVIDLVELETSDTASLTVFAALARHARAWPGTALLLCGAAPEVKVGLGTLGVTRHVELWPGVESALAALGRRHGHPVLCHELPRSARAPAVARRLAQEACLHLGLVPALIDAEIVSSELVANVVEHGAGRPVLRFERRADDLVISVADNRSLPLRSAPRPGREERGRGLLLVAAISASWGVQATPTGGKVVWALLRPPE